MPLRLPIAEFEDQITRADEWLGASIAELMEGLRPQHPVSVLELSADDAAVAALGSRLRVERRKVRIMAYHWSVPGSVQGSFPGGNPIAGAGTVPAEQTARSILQEFPGPPEFPGMLVEKGSLPGLRFSSGSFDYLAGRQVLQRLPPAMRARALADMRRVALRQVLLIEFPGAHGAAGVSESSVADALIQGGIRDAAITQHDGLLAISFYP